MAVSFESIGQVCVTCFASNVQVNTPCKLSTNNFVTPCVENDAIEGVVVAENANLATVAVKGFVTLTYFGDAPTLGFCPLAANGSGKIKKQEGAREYLVFNVNTAKKTVTFYL